MTSHLVINVLSREHAEQLKHYLPEWTAIKVDSELGIYCLSLPFCDWYLYKDAYKFLETVKLVTSLSPEELRYTEYYPSSNLGYRDYIEVDYSELIPVFGYYQFGGLRLELDSNKVWFNGVRIHTIKEIITIIEKGNRQFRNEFSKVFRRGLFVIPDNEWRKKLEDILDW